MAADQLPAEVGEFVTYLDGLLARLDPSGGWCAVFWQRDPEGMRACLEGRDMPPWDVVEALLQDLAGQYGPGGAGPETERARALHAAALAVYDTRPGGRDALGDRLDVMLREQKYAAERQAALARHLTSATTPEQADALRLDLAWARDDHARAAARCAELRARMAHVDRRERGVASAEWGERGVPPAEWGDGAGLRGAGTASPVAAPQRGGTGSAAAATGRYGAADPEAGGPGGHRPAARGVSGEAATGVAPDPAPGPSPRPGTGARETGWPARQHPQSRSDFGEPAAGATPEGFTHPAGSGAGWQTQRHPASRSGSGDAAAGATSDGFTAPDGIEAARLGRQHSASRSGSGDVAAGASPEVFTAPDGTEAARLGRQHSASRSGSGDVAAGANPEVFTAPDGAEAGRRAQERPVGRSVPGGVLADGVSDALSAPASEPSASKPSKPPKPRKRRRGSARFAGMVDEEDAVVVPPAVVPTLPAPAPAPVATGRTTPRGARFAGAGEEDVVEPSVREGGAVGAVDLVEVGRTVDLLARLRGEGRSGEAHALLAEVASWEPGRFPLLAERLHRAGLDADWQTLLWEAASLPAGRLVAAADALVEAGRAGDGQQMLRQGVARPPGEVGEAVLGLAAERRHREVRVLLDAYVRARTPEEAARSAEPDPRRLVPLLLEAAQGVSDERRWDLVHALRVAGFAA
ncbi:hypothetical protein ACIPIU_06930 [Streptomyces massasporeus]|uniref:hypothetical protein n=1 Tax=Streptomyces massasporeus TaxID=67324 RepID=UPI003816B124